MEFERDHSCHRGPFFALVAGVLLLASGCAMSMRHQTLDAEPSVRGVTANIDGSQTIASAGMVLDFRYVRFMYPIAMRDFDYVVTDTEGGRGTSGARQRERYVRIDAPTLSLWNTQTSGMTYAPLVPKRQSIDIWLGLESDLAVDSPSFWGDLSIGYYHYNLVGVRLFAGWGSQHYDLSTTGIGSGFPNLWKGDASGFGGGLEVTVTAGEYALDFLQWLLDVEDQQRKVLRD